MCPQTRIVSVGCFRNESLNRTGHGHASTRLSINHVEPHSSQSFPWLTEELGPLTDTHKQVIATLELVRIETLMRDWPGLPGRPLRDRAALARAFVAKAVMGLPTTSMLIERLAVDKRLRPGDPARNADRRAGEQSLRPDGQRL